MSPAAASPSPTAPPPADACAASRARTERHLAVLDRLIEIGMDIAEAAGRQARDWLDGAAPADAAGTDGSAGAPFCVDPGLTCSRAARAVRLTIALAERLADDQAKADKARADIRRDRIQRVIGRAVESQNRDHREIGRLCCEASERLSDEDAFGDLATRPIDEVVTLICRELGLDPTPWVRGFADGEPGADDNPPPPPHPSARRRSGVARGRDDGEGGDGDDGEGGGDPGAGDGPDDPGHGRRPGGDERRLRRPTGPDPGDGRGSAAPDP